MLQRQSYAPASVYALADHLDGALAACEDLLALNGQHVDLEWFLASVRRFELAAILQVLRARQYAEELRSSQAHVATVAALFLAGTAAFTEASGAQVTSPFDADRTGDARDLAITDAFMIGRRVPMGALVQMVGAFLDALEIAYVLYDGDGLSTTLRSRPPLPRTVPPPLPPLDNLYPARPH